MALPKIKQPIFELTIPSTGKNIRYKPFTVAEEKLLLVAKESNETKDIVNAYKGIINNCCLDPVDVDKLCSFDIEYLFINIRSKSVSNIIEATDYRRRRWKQVQRRNQSRCSTSEQTFCRKNRQAERRHNGV